MKKMLLAVFTMFMANIALADLKPLTICTGGEGGAYESLGSQIGKDIAAKTGAKLEVLNTGGSIENAEMMSDGDCYIAIMQGDAVVANGLPRDITMTSAHKEAAIWMFGADGVEDFSDMTSSKHKNKSVAIVAGSGAAVTLKNFGDVDKDYLEVNPVEFDDWYLAAEAAAQGYTLKAGVRINIGGLLYVGRPGFIPNDITELFGDKLKVGEIDESSFSSAKDMAGNQLYFTCELNEQLTNGIKINSWSDPDTYCMNAVVIYSEAYTEGLEKKQARDVKRAVSRSINTTINAVRKAAL